MINMCVDFVEVEVCKLQQFLFLFVSVYILLRGFACTVNSIQQ